MNLPNSNKALAKRKYLLLKLADFSKRHIAVFAVVFGAIGGIVLLNDSSAKLPAPTIYLTPDTKTIAANTNFDVEVRMDSGSTMVNAVQADFTYPADLIEFVSIDGTGSAFTTAAPSTGGNGTVSIARGNIDPVSGDKLVAIVKFKTKAANGNATLAFVDGTLLMDAATNQDILGGLQKTTGASYTVGSGSTNPNPPTPNPEPGTKKLLLQPQTANVALNGEFTVEVRTNSGTTNVNAVQANFSYPADLVDFVRIDGADSAFTTEAPSTGGSGTVSIARGNIQPVSGEKLVAKVVFKAKSTAGTATMAFTNGTALLDSTTNQDILGGLSGTSGGTYNIGGGTNPNPNPPGPNPNPPGPNPNPVPGKKLYMLPQNETFQRNTEFTVEIRSNSGTTAVNAVQANFSYPANLLDFVSIDGTGSAYGTAAPSTGGNGSVSIARGNIEPVSGDKLVAKVKFKTKDTAATATLAFTDGTALMSATSNEDILAGLSDTSGGSYIITGSSNPNPPGPNPNPTPKRGDVDGDGNVNFEDLAKLLLKWGTNDAAADIDDDGTVTIYDLSILLSNYGT